MANKLSKIRVKKIDLVGVPAIGETITLFKNKEGNVNRDELLKALKDMKDEERAEVLKSLGITAPNPVEMIEKLSDEDKEKVRKALIAKDEPPTAEAILKALTDALKKDDDKKEEIPEHIAKAIQGLQERVEKAEKDAEDAREELAKRQTMEKKAEAVKLAKEFSDAGFTPDDDADAIQKLREADPKAWEQVEKRMRAASTLIKESALLREFGSGEPAEGSAAAEVEARAAEIRKADPKLTSEQARSQVLKSDVALANRVYDEERERAK